MVTKNGRQTSSKGKIGNKIMFQTGKRNGKQNASGMFQRIINECE
jgi:hypothetical protein